ncbi:IclR family transcriptional regulator [Aerococcus mictus]|uniref:IclR family transcriptional regulator n=1 Tax=Aerococcus mictus TaxID=2976810 RepID=UPI000DCCA3D0|nr:IclR family transcriptional regulator [Aerococcus mictus]KAA9233747.1 IclR family transcriptional regulator [Aerococcus mictus]MDL5183858.1 IclR family transcriptional regulator [Aerococcus mictus]
MSKNTISSIINAFKILDYINAHPNNGVNNITSNIALPKTTVHRILQTLLSIQIINKTLSGNYTIGYKLSNYTIQNSFSDTLINVSKNFIDECAVKLKETVNLGLNFNGHVYMIYHHSGEDYVLQMKPKISSLLHCSGSGKLFLYNYSKEEQVNYFSNPLPKYTDNTITSLAEMEKDFSQFEKHQVMLDNEELEYGLKCIAAPIKDSNGNILASLSVSGPVNRLEKKGTQYIGEELLATAKNISQKLQNSNIIIQ